jgi:hypothetical protein
LKAWPLSSSAFRGEYRFWSSLEKAPSAKIASDALRANSPPYREHLPLRGQRHQPHRFEAAPGHPVLRRHPGVHAAVGGGAQELVVAPAGTDFGELHLVPGQHRVVGLHVHLVRLAVHEGIGPAVRNQGGVVAFCFGDGRQQGPARLVAHVLQEKLFGVGELQSQWVARVVLFPVEVGEEAELAGLQPVGDRQDGAAVVAVGVLEVDADAGVRGNDHGGRKRDFCRVVVDHVVEVEAALQEPAVEVHPFGVRQHDDEPFVARAAQPVGSLHAFTHRQLYRREFTLRHGHAHGGSRPALADGCVTGFGLAALHTAVVAQKVRRVVAAVEPPGVAEHYVAGQQLPALAR